MGVWSAMAARELRSRAALFIPEKKQQISRQAGCGDGEKTYRKADIRQTAGKERGTAQRQRHR